MSKIYSKTEQFISGYINLLYSDALYLRSNISNLSNIGPLGYFSDIIKKVNVNAAYGNLISTQYNDELDFVEVNKCTLTELKFRLTDANDNVMDLNGNNISFTLIFLQ